jgi:glycosyltransferase involved in cell wall biosynthesis
MSVRGNTIMGVVAELGRCEAADGDVPGVVVSANRDVHLDGLDNLVVDYTRYCPREWFTRSERARDDLAGRLGRRRRFTGDLYLPAIAAAREWGPDLVFVYEGLSGAATLPDWRRALPDATLVLALHSPLARSYGRRELERTLGHADHVVCVSESLRTRLVDRAPGVAGRTRVIGNGVDLTTFRPADPPGPSAGGDGPGTPFSLLFVGQVAPHKGPHRMLEAMARAAPRLERPLRATVVGSSAYDPGTALSDYERSLRDLAGTSGLDVAFVPFTDKESLAGFYRAASLVCVPSEVAEAFGMVAVEAMACGTAVVVSDRGALPEVGGDAVRVVDTADVDRFADVLVELVEHPDRLADMEAAGLRRARDRSWESVDRQLTGLARR